MKDQLADGWTTKPLSEIATFSNGLWKGKKGPFTTAKVLRNTNFRPHGALSLDDIAEIDVETKQLEKRRLQKGDIILERSGGGPKQPVGRVVLFDRDDGIFSFSNFTSVVRITDKAKVEPAYLHQVLNWWHASGVTEGIQSRSTGIRNLDFKAYKELGVPLPPLEEQQRIVAVLDEAFEGLTRARAHAEANLQNAQELVATSTDALCSGATDDWKNGKMGDFCTFEGGFAFKSGDAVKQSQVQLIRIGNLYQNILDLERRPVFYPDDFAEAYSKFRLNAGDIILSLTGTVGKQDYGFAVAVPETDRALLLNQRVARIMPRNVDILSPNFLLRFLRSGSFLATLYNISRGTRQANLSTRDMAELPMPVPPITKQLEIVESLDSIDARSVQLIAAYERSIVDLDDLRQSLLQKAFAGELT